MRKILFIIVFLFWKQNGYSQIIYSNDLRNSKSEVSSILKIIKPEELIFIDTISALNLALREIDEEKGNLNNSLNLMLEYPWHSCKLSKVFKSRELGSYLFDYYKKIPKVYSHEQDTFAIRFGYGIFEDLLSGLILQNPPDLVKQIINDYNTFGNISARLRSKYRTKIDKKIIISGRYRTIRSGYYNSQFLTLKCAYALNFIDSHLYSNQRLDSIRNNQNSTYEFPLSHKPQSASRDKIDSLKQANPAFPAYSIRLSRNYDDIESLVENDSTINNEIFKKTSGDLFNWVVKFHRVIRPVVINKNYAIFWHVFSNEGKDSGTRTLYRIKKIDDNTISLQIVEAFIQ